MYDDNGRITNVAILSDETFAIYSEAGEQKMVVGIQGDPATQYIVNKELCEYTVVEADAIANLRPGWIWKMPERIAVDGRTLGALIDSAVMAVDQQADAARLIVVGDPVRIKEYERAEQQARAFRADGYSGDVPASVECWAAAKGWSAQHAADDILAASVRWYAALDAIRALRLAAKEDIKRAAANSAADAILANFSTALTTALQAVQ